ncbi:cytochrome-c oxidase, cbb3-type subunit III [Rhodobacteraceae bacterium]|nr:cytochrome-c oxidase, cbb3-type subunit III [Paracoccaceae bacterium]
MTRKIDKVSGQYTTGHEWDGIEELNTPMPRAFRVWLVLSIAVCVPFWFLYPSFPAMTAYLGGMLGYSSREAVQLEVTKGVEQRQLEFSALETTALVELATDDRFRNQYQPEISALFRDNCAACHGGDAQGQIGFPNLTDEAWLWSSEPEQIEQTIRFGINAQHDETRVAQMPAIGREEWLNASEISDVIDYVLSISGQVNDQMAAVRGAELFSETCASCHNDQGQGGLDNGAPRLTDEAWIYGGSRTELEQTLEFGRSGVMPAWSGRLTDDQIRLLTLYILWQNDDEL